MGNLPDGSAERKLLPVTTGVLDYFPKAIAYVAWVSKVGNDQHNPGQPLHWSRGKSDDHPDCIGRHLLDRGSFQPNGLLHDGGLAWRSLASLELTLEAMEAQGLDPFKPFGGVPQKPVVQLMPPLTGAVTGFNRSTFEPLGSDPVADEAHHAVTTINEHAHGDDHAHHLGTHSG